MIETRVSPRVFHTLYAGLCAFLPVILCILPPNLLRYVGGVSYLNTALRHCYCQLRAATSDHIRQPLRGRHDHVTALGDPTIHTRHSVYHSRVSRTCVVTRSFNHCGTKAKGKHVKMSPSREYYQKNIKVKYRQRRHTTTANNDS
jgi:hypothetical protein